MVADVKAQSADETKATGLVEGRSSPGRRTTLALDAEKPMLKPVLKVDRLFRGASTKKL